MKVSCLTATHGRYSVLEEAISCFLEQTYQDKELIILNNHPVPIVCDLPQVTVINGEHYKTLGDCRNRLLELATGHYVKTWDDDDLYLPWAISQGVESFPDGADIWQPEKSWSWHKSNKTIDFRGNVYEASWITLASSARDVGYLEGSGGNEHAPLKKLKRVRGKITPCEASYVYTWGTGLCHISGTLGHKNGVEWRTERWKKRNNDHGSEEPIKKVSLNHYWEMLQERACELDDHANEAG
jgi:hypothetical protein